MGIAFRFDIAKNPPLSPAHITCCGYPDQPASNRKYERKLPSLGRDTEGVVPMFLFGVLGIFSYDERLVEENLLAFGLADLVLCPSYGIMRHSRRVYPLNMVVL